MCRLAKSSARDVFVSPPLSMWTAQKWWRKINESTAGLCEELAACYIPYVSKFMAGQAQVYISCVAHNKPTAYGLQCVHVRFSSPTCGAQAWSLCSCDVDTRPVKIYRRSGGCPRVLRTSVAVTNGCLSARRRGYMCCEYGYSLVLSLRTRNNWSNS